MTITDSLELYHNACREAETYGQPGTGMAESYVLYGSNSPYENRRAAYLEPYFIRIIEAMVYELVIKGNSPLLSRLCSANGIYPDLRNVRIDRENVRARGPGSYDLKPLLDGLNMAFSGDLSKCSTLYFSKYSKSAFQGYRFHDACDYHGWVMRALAELDAHMAAFRAAGSDVPWETGGKVEQQDGAAKEQNRETEPGTDFAADDRVKTKVVTEAAIVPESKMKDPAFASEETKTGMVPGEKTEAGTETDGNTVTDDVQESTETDGGTEVIPSSEEMENTEDGKETDGGMEVIPSSEEMENTEDDKETDGGTEVIPSSEEMENTEDDKETDGGTEVIPPPEEMEKTGADAETDVKTGVDTVPGGKEERTKPGDTVEKDTAGETAERKPDATVRKFHEIAMARASSEERFLEEISGLQRQLQDGLKQIREIREGVEYSFLLEALQQLTALYEQVEDILQYHHPGAGNTENYEDLIESCYAFRDNIGQAVSMLGASMICEVNVLYDPKYHQTAPGIRPVRNSRVVKILRKGFVYKDKVLEKALVEIAGPA